MDPKNKDHPVIQKLLAQGLRCNIISLDSRIPDSVASWVVTQDNTFNSGMQDSVVEWLQLFVNEYPQWLLECWQKGYDASNVGRQKEMRAQMAIFLSGRFSEGHPLKTLLKAWNFCNTMLQLAQALNMDFRGPAREQFQAHLRARAAETDSLPLSDSLSASSSGEAGDEGRDDSFKTLMDLVPEHNDSVPNLFDQFKLFWEGYVDSCNPDSPVQGADIARIGHSLKASLDSVAKKCKGCKPNAAELAIIWFELWKFSMPVDEEAFASSEDPSMSFFERQFDKNDSGLRTYVEKILSADLTESESCKVCAATVQPKQQKPKGNPKSAKGRKDVGDARKKVAMMALSKQMEHVDGGNVLFLEIIAASVRMCAPSFESDKKGFVATSMTIVHLLFRFTFQKELSLGARDIKALSELLLTLLTTYGKGDLVKDLAPKVDNSWITALTTSSDLSDISEALLKATLPGSDAGPMSATVSVQDPAAGPLQLEPLDLSQGSAWYSKMVSFGQFAKAIPRLRALPEVSTSIDAILQNEILGLERCKLVPRLLSIVFEAFPQDRIRCAQHWLACMERESVCDLPEAASSFQITTTSLQAASCLRSSVLIHVLKEANSEEPGVLSAALPSWLGEIKGQVEEFAANDVRLSDLTAFKEFWMRILACKSIAEAKKQTVEAVTPCGATEASGSGIIVSQENEFLSPGFGNSSNNRPPPPTPMDQRSSGGCGAEAEQAPRLQYISLANLYSYCGTNGSGMSRGITRCAPCYNRLEDELSVVFSDIFHDGFLGHGEVAGLPKFLGQALFSKLVIDLGDDPSKAAIHAKWPLSTIKIPFFGRVTTDGDNTCLGPVAWIDGQNFWLRPYGSSVAAKAVSAAQLVMSTKVSAEQSTVQFETCSITLYASKSGKIYTTSSDHAPGSPVAVEEAGTAGTPSKRRMPATPATPSSAGKRRKVQQQADRDAFTLTVPFWVPTEKAANLPSTTASIIKLATHKTPSFTYKAFAKNNSVFSLESCDSSLQALRKEADVQMSVVVATAKDSKAAKANKRDDDVKHLMD